MFLRIHTISETNNCRLIDTLTTVNENYVNKLSTWAAYFIFPHSIGYFAKCWCYPYTVTHNFRTV